MGEKKSMFPNVEGIVKDYAERAKASALGKLADAVPGLGSLVSSNSIEFPDELQEIDHSVTFSAYETTKALRLDPDKEQLLATVKLPIPGNLQTAYNISYTETSLGALGREFMDALGGDPNAEKFITSNAKALGTGAAAGATVGVLAGTGAIGGALTGAAGGVALKTIMDTVNGDSRNAAVVGSTLIGTDPMAMAAASQFGVARNPHKVVLFESVGFRKHSFSYQFTPKNRGESNRLKRLIHLFKYHASPGMNPTKQLQFSKINDFLKKEDGTSVTDFKNVTVSGGKHFFKYPEFFKIQFKHPHFLFQIGNSFLTSVDVNYQPAGAPTYARDSYDDKPAPTQINLSLTFTETDIVTKENISTGR